MIGLALISVLTLVFSVLNFVFLIPAVRILVDLKEELQSKEKEVVEPVEPSALVDLPPTRSWHYIDPLKEID